MTTMMILDPAYTVKETQKPIQSGNQTSVSTYTYFDDTTSAIPTLEEYRQIFINAGRSPEFVERLVDGLSKSSLYDSQDS